MKILQCLHVGQSSAASGSVPPAFMMRSVENALIHMFTHLVCAEEEEEEEVETDFRMFIF